MLVACRLAGLSALEGTMVAGTGARNKPMRHWRSCSGQHWRRVGRAGWEFRLAFPFLWRVEPSGTALRRLG